jgi:hypothetical protein
LRIAESRARKRRQKDINYLFNPGNASRNEREIHKLRGRTCPAASVAASVFAGFAVSRKLNMV